MSALPQSRPHRMVLLVGHMRSGSTALSSVLCNHCAISGYGETHVTHGASWSGGAMILNQWRRGAWDRQARYVFDKVLHNQYDDDAIAEYVRAHVIMLARTPDTSIRSIRNLADTLELGHWRTDVAAADYYEKRVSRMLELWPHGHAARWTAITHATLTRSPDDILAHLTTLLGVDPPLANEYARKNASSRHGSGDPLVATSQSRIVASGGVSSIAAKAGIELDLPASRLEALQTLYGEFEGICRTLG